MVRGQRAPHPTPLVDQSEPSAYSYGQLVKDGKTDWTGVRNFEARNNLRAMILGDLCLYYHSNEGKALVGVARVAATAKADATASDEDWVPVEVEPVAQLKQPVTLEAIRADPAFADFPLVTRSRLSVASVTREHFERILQLSGTRL